MPSPKNPTMLTPKRAVPSMSFSHIHYRLRCVSSCLRTPDLKLADQPRLAPGLPDDPPILVMQDAAIAQERATRTRREDLALGTDPVLKWHRATITPTSDIEGAVPRRARRRAPRLLKSSADSYRITLAHSTKCRRGVVVSKTCSNCSHR